jgi:RNA polymerase-binding transcription factor DksA
VYEEGSTDELDLTDIGNASGLSEAEVTELAELLEQRRRGDVAEAQRLAESLGSLLASRSESTADDEHDPEGPTLSSEWSRLEALRADAAQDMIAVREALERIDLGTYGVCARRYRPIGVDRLRARPTARLCITCATLAES